MRTIFDNTFRKMYRIPSAPLKTGQKTNYHAGDDGDLEKGISRSYQILTTGQYSGTTNITINGKTVALSNNCVIDERTGLMWARYLPQSDIGPGANGKLFWAQWTLAAESCTFATAGDTITAAAGNPFNVTALVIGRKITITGTTNNNGVVTVSAIADNIITVSENLTDEGPVNTTFATLDDLIWDAKDQANANTLGGHTGWRVPNGVETFSLIDWSFHSPSIDTISFPSTPTATYWTSTTSLASTVTYAYSIYFNYGYLSYVHKKGSAQYVRLVRDN